MATSWPEPMCTASIVPPSWEETSMPWNALVEPIAEMAGVQLSVSALAALDADYTPAQVRSAWLLHGFTTLGIVAAMLALRDVLVDRPSYAIIWLLLTLLIDGVDDRIDTAYRFVRETVAGGGAALAIKPLMISGFIAKWKV